MFENLRCWITIRDRIASIKMEWFHMRSEALWVATVFIRTSVSLSCFIARESKFVIKALKKTCSFLLPSYLNIEWRSNR
jgi:hypothetical protein